VKREKKTYLHAKNRFLRQLQCMLLCIGFLSASVLGFKSTRAEEIGSYCRLTTPSWAACHIIATTDGAQCSCTDVIGLEYPGTTGLPSDSNLIELPAAQVQAGDFAVYGVPPLSTGTVVIVPRNRSAITDASLRSLLASRSVENLEAVRPLPPVLRPAPNPITSPLAPRR
jgi:hypothetical protein